MQRIRFDANCNPTTLSYLELGDKCQQRASMRRMELIISFQICCRLFFFINSYSNARLGLPITTMVVMMMEMQMIVGLMGMEVPI